MKIKILTADLIRKYLSKRVPDSHKGDYGHALIIAGSRNYPGAAALCANACARSGSGLTTLACPASVSVSIESRLLPEVIVLPLPDTNGYISSAGAGTVLEYIGRRKVTSVSLGCGISVSVETEKFVKKILADVKLPVVIDADGLNIAVAKPDVLKRLKSNTIITPHPGEMSRLSGIKTDKIQKNRSASAAAFAAAYNLICVLKGYRTVISDGKNNFVNLTGNPGMAKGGSGDVLAGMITGFIGQTESLTAAACLGVFLHGLAGDAAMKDKTDISMLPSDIIENISVAVKIIRKQ